MKHITIVEVGPRDGWQNLPAYIPVGRKLYYIDKLLDAGISSIQVTSFVSPKAIPQLRDAREVVTSSLERHPGADLFALVPNLYGARAAAEAGLTKVATVISLSQSHNRANVRRTHDESFSELDRLLQQLPELEVCLDVATAFGCPFEGKFRDPDPLLAFLRRGWDLGIRSFNLCDTVGLADPAQMRIALSAVRASFPDIRLQVHIHDTRNMGVVNTLAAIECGVTEIQSTLGGLGGCPFAPGASGNTATEDLVYLLHEMGYRTGVDFDSLLRLAREEAAELEGNYSGHQLRISPCPLPA